MAGQSNLQGFKGDAAYYPADPEGLDQTIPFYWVSLGSSDSGGEWLTLQKQPGLFPNGHFGPEIIFAREMKRSGLNPAIFKYCCPRTSIAEHWGLPGQGGLYDHFLQVLAQAINSLIAQGHTPRYAATIWIQGESDARTPEMAEAYKPRLKTLIDHFRRDVLKKDNGIFLLGVDAEHPYCLRNQQVVAAQKQLATEGTNIGFVSMVKLQKADLSHLTPAGLQDHGRRLAVAFRLVSERAEIGASTPPASTSPSSQ